MLLASARDIPHWGAITHRQDCLNPSLSCSGDHLDRITYFFRLARAQLAALASDAVWGMAWARQDGQVPSCCDRCSFPDQTTRKLSPDLLAVTGPSAQALPAWLPLHELAHDEDHTCSSEEEPCVN